MSVPSAKVLLTGATGGLGHAIARAFAARGDELVLSGRRPDALEALASELGAQAVPCDLAERAEVERLVAAAGDVDVLVANAALPASGLLTDLTQAEVDRLLEVNLRAPIALAHALAPAMITRGSGHMVFISSLAAKSASPASSMYSATKFGLRGFALGLREDLRQHGVGVSLVAPGFIRDAGLFADAQVELPLGVGTRSPEDVARAVIGAIDRDRTEVSVAPMPLRIGSSLAGLWPGVAAPVSRLLGSERLAAKLAEGQRDKRW